LKLSSSDEASAKPLPASASPKRVSVLQCSWSVSHLPASASPKRARERALDGPQDEKGAAAGSLSSLKMPKKSSWKKNSCSASRSGLAWRSAMKAA
jgi:hypothetical protein